MSQYFNCPHLNCLTCNCTQNQKNIVFTALKMPCTNDSATMTHLLSPYLAKKPLWKFSYHYCLDQETIKKTFIKFFEAVVSLYIVIVCFLSKKNGFEIFKYNND